MVCQAGAVDGMQSVGPFGNALQAPALLSHLTCPPAPISAQVVRQRDTLRQLLQSTGNDLDAARKTYASSLGAASPGQLGAGAASPQPAAAGAAAGGEGGAGGSGAAGGPDFRALHADMEQQLRDYKTEAAKTHEMLSTDVSGC